jgi:hypothetical protein
MKRICGALLLLLPLSNGFSDELSANEKARRIEKTLLISDLTVLGFIAGLKRNMLIGASLDNEVEECIRRKGEKVLSYAYATAIVETLSESELDEGYRKSKGLALKNANDYILKNIHFLKNEYNSANKDQKASDFFLITATKQPGVSESDRQSILDFVSWHQDSRFHEIRKNWRLEYSLLISDLSKVLQNCTKQ